MDQSEDLPLSSNHDQFQVDDYSINLHCNTRKRIFSGDVTLQISQGPKWNGESEVILDCSDLEVKSVEILDKADSKGTKLEHSVDSWSVKISLPLLATGKDRESLRLRIEYETRPDTRSLHWRQDYDGHVCVYTAAASINNRGLLPCQDIPAALSTWSARISLSSEDGHLDVFCTGEAEAEVEECGYLRYYLYHHKSFPLPISTFAIALGSWTIRSIDCGHPKTRFIGPPRLIESNFEALNKYLPSCLAAAEDLLGKYPLPRLEVLVVHRSFSGLGLASPNLLFLSPSLFGGDQSLLIKVSHEISHAWFGIMLGSMDWTEAWISEGFATFLEEIIHDSALNHMNHRLPSLLSPLRAQLKLETLQEEVCNTEADLQMLQPMAGRESEAERFVRNGLNPVAGLTQAHYLKGYFLLHYLKETSPSTQEFFTLMKEYISRYFGQLVNSSHFIEMFYEKFRASTPVPQTEFVQTWLHSPGVPSHIEHLQIIKDIRNNELYVDVLEAVKEIEFISDKIKLKRFKECSLEQELRYPDQVSLFFNYLLRLQTIQGIGKVLAELRAQYNDFITTNCDIGHKWAEIVIKNKFRRDFNFVSDYLINNQSMGVYLYGELLLSKNKTMRRLLDEIWELLENEMDRNSISIIEKMKS